MKISFAIPRIIRLTERITIGLVLALLHSCVPKAAYDQLNFEFTENQIQLGKCRITEQNIDIDIRNMNFALDSQKASNTSEDQWEVYEDLRVKLKACSKDNFSQCIEEWRSGQQDVLSKTTNEWKVKVDLKVRDRDSIWLITDSLQSRWHFLDSACRIGRSELDSSRFETMISVEKQLPLKEKIKAAFVSDSFYLKTQYDLLYLKNDTIKKRLAECSSSNERKLILSEELYQASRKTYNYSDNYTKKREIKREIEQIIGDRNVPRNGPIYAIYSLAETSVINARDPKRKQLNSLKERYLNLEKVIKNAVLDQTKWELFNKSLERDCPMATRAFEWYIKEKYKPVDTAALVTINQSTETSVSVISQRIGQNDDPKKTPSTESDGNIALSIKPPQLKETNSLPRVIFERKISSDDSDGDGVPNAIDKCPFTPIEHFPVDDYGCSKINRDKDECGADEDPDDEVMGPGNCNCLPCDDDDEDGVFNFEDLCPDKKGHPSNKGCPMLLEQAAFDSLAFSSKSSEAYGDDLEGLRLKITTMSSGNKPMKFILIGIGDISEGNALYYAQKRIDFLMKKMQEWGLQPSSIQFEPQQNSPTYRFTRAVYIYVG